MTLRPKPTTKALHWWLALYLAVIALVGLWTRQVLAADLTITAANVVAGAGSTTEIGTAGETVTAGQVVYLDTADNKLKLADANAAGKTTIAGIALNGASNNQPLKYLTGGSITIGATVAVGTTYVLSATAGGIAPNVDAASGWTKSHVGVATSTTAIDVKIHNSGAAIP